jgi:hypothetical protein
MYIVWNSVAAIRELSEGSIRHGTKLMDRQCLENWLMAVDRSVKPAAGSVFSE